ncbi:MAG: hypothetical protein AABZ47_10930 [Planctomycetota bacterium]
MAEKKQPLQGHRPWRTVGAAICVVLVVMFVAGERVFDVPTATLHPRAFILFWLVMLVLVVWLCLLAVQDILYTRRLVAQWRANLARRVSSESNEAVPKDECRHDQTR